MWFIIFFGGPACLAIGSQEGLDPWVRFPLLGVGFAIVIAIGWAISSEEDCTRL